MKTTEEIRDLVAQKYKYKNWEHLHIKVGGTEMDSFTDEAMELYAEQRLLLSSEAEKGEADPLNLQEPQYVSLVTWKAVQGTDHGWHEWWRDNNKTYFPDNSPPSPQEKQGVEYEYEMFFDEGAGEFVQLQGWFPIAKNMIRHPERIEHYIERGLLRRITPAPAAPDKGEELTDEQRIEYYERLLELAECPAILMEYPHWPFGGAPTEDDRKLAMERIEEYKLRNRKSQNSDKLENNGKSPSVEKSEGEEAVEIHNPQFKDYFLRLNEVINVTGKITKNDLEYCALLTLNEIEYAHSSGDTGRKEWPTNVEIFKKSKTCADMVDSEHAKLWMPEGFRDGAQWAINEVRQMNQGKK